EHPLMVSVLNNLANLYWQQGKYDQAEPLYQRALCIWEQALEPEHPDVARLLNNLASLYREQGKYDQAEPLYQRALRIWEQTPESEHPLMTSVLSATQGLRWGKENSTGRMPGEPDKDAKAEKGRMMKKLIN